MGVSALDAARARRAARMTPRERRQRLDAYAAARMLVTHFPTVARFPEEAVRAIRGKAPGVPRDPGAVTADALATLNGAAGVGGPRA
jgi:hypothetical protein